MNIQRIGILREEKNPPDSRVPLSPEQCLQLQQENPGLEIWVQPSPHRCFADAAYQAQGITLCEDLSSCDLLMGVKEVPISKLIAHKNYLFFSHTIKKQPYNQKLLKAVLAQQIRLMDYEVLTRPDHSRVIAFGHWAGVVGAHNGIMAWGLRNKAFDLPQMKHFKTFEQATQAYQTLDIKSAPLRVVLSGTGRVSMGARRTLEAMGMQALSPEAFLQGNFPQGACFTQLSAKDYVRHKTQGENFKTQDFYAQPQDFISSFAPYTQLANVFINGIFWHELAPRFFELDAIKKENFRIETIADISCDMHGSVPTTVFASSIAVPVYGYHRHTGDIVAPYTPESLDMMTIDNLPSELPIDASISFGQQFMQEVWPEFAGKTNTNMLLRATIAMQGKLGPHFQYLSDYAYEIKNAE